MHLLVDTDYLVYRAGFSANQPDQEAIAVKTARDMVHTLLQETSAATYQLYLSGGRTFRYDIYPEYKGNRVNARRPLHMEAIREMLVSDFGATVCDGEADDAVGIVQSSFRGEDTSCIAHVDKDIDMIVGDHYNPVKKEWYSVSNEQAIRHFYWQLIMGDRSDNIPGFDGLMRVTVPKKLEGAIEELQECSNPEEMLLHVSGMWNCYDDDERWGQFNMAAQCLWIQRREDDDWRTWLNENTMEELGLPVGLIRSLPPPYGAPAASGLLSTAS